MYRLLWNMNMADGPDDQQESVWSSEVYGLDMEDPRLISAVKQAILPPAKREEPYYLEIHETVYFAQFEQDKLIETMFNKMASSYYFTLEGKKIL